MPHRLRCPGARWPMPRSPASSYTIRNEANMKRFALIQAADNKYIDCKWPDACASCHSSRVEKYHTPTDAHDRFVFANDIPYCSSCHDKIIKGRIAGFAAPAITTISVFYLYGLKTALFAGFIVYYLIFRFLSKKQAVRIKNYDSGGKRYPIVTILNDRFAEEFKRMNKETIIKEYSQQFWTAAKF